jgi:transcriptional regulator with XRE-family HTH domain
MRYGAGQVPEPIGALIVRLREEHGLTQLRLAARLCASAGVDTVTRHEVSRWERGERIPSGYWLSWLAVALEVDPDELDRAAGASRRHRRQRQWLPPDWYEEAIGVYARRAS